MASKFFCGWCKKNYNHGTLLSHESECPVKKAKGK